MHILVDKVPTAHWDNYRADETLSSLAFRGDDLAISLSMDGFENVFGTDLSIFSR